MKINDEPWSKKVWYIEGLILLLMIFTGVYTNFAAMLILVILSVIVIGIISIYYKRIESADIKPQLVPSNSFSQQLENTSSGASYDEDQYSSLRNLLNIPASSSSSNTQQLAPIDAKHSSTIVIEDKKQAKYVTFEGIQYRVRSKSLKIHNKFIKSITDIEGLDEVWRLRKLDLSQNQITSMKGIEYLPNLRILKLSDNKIQKIENIKHFKQLKKLSIDKNQLKELYDPDLPNTLKYINIAKNPIEKFHIYAKTTYKIIHFGPKKWFPKQELKTLKKLMRSKSKSYRSYDAKGGFLKFLLIFGVWAGITFGIACLINLIIWGAITNIHSMMHDPIQLNFWVLLFAKEWSVGLFFGAGILTAIGMTVLYYEQK